MSVMKKRNIFRMELWLFALIFLMIFSGVVTWLRFSYDSAEKFILKWEWITPQGKLYHRGEVEMESGSYINYRTWYWIKIKGNYASQLPGEWKVRVYINDISLAERNFFIVGTF